MSRLMSMSFRGFTFPNNPTELTVEEEQTVNETLLPFSGTRTENLGTRHRRVTGVGYLTGDDCWTQWEQLQAECHKPGAGCLRLPGLVPMTAVAEKLQLMGVSGAHAVKYRFVFVEWNDETEPKRSETLTATGGESLWDIARQVGCTVHQLAEANPHIRDIDSLCAGERVVVP